MLKKVYNLITYFIIIISEFIGFGFILKMLLTKDIVMILMGIVGLVIIFEILFNESAKFYDLSSEGGTDE